MNLYFRLLRMLLTHRLRRGVSLWDGTDTSFQVWPTDLDTVGHMNNAKYFGLMDLGRIDLMLRSRMLQRTREHGWYAVVSAQTIRYRRSLKPRQRFVLQTRVLGIDEKAVYFRQSFLAGGELYAEAVVQCRILRKEGGSVPAAEAVAAFSDGSGAGREPDLTLPAWVQDWAVGIRQSA